MRRNDEGRESRRGGEEKWKLETGRKKREDENSRRIRVMEEGSRRREKMKEEKEGKMVKQSENKRGKMKIAMRIRAMGRRRQTRDEGSERRKGEKEG